MVKIKRPSKFRTHDTEVMGMKFNERSKCTRFSGQSRLMSHLCRHHRIFVAATAGFHSAGYDGERVKLGRSNFFECF